MANGVFSGVIWGALVAVAGAGSLSLAYPDYKPGGSSDAMQEAVVEEVSATEEVAVTVVSETPAMDVDETTQPEAAPEEVVEDIAEDVVSEEQPETPMADVFAEDEVFDPEAGEAELETAEVAETEQAEPETVGADAVEAEPEAEPEVNGAKTSVAEVEIEPETAAEETVENANAAKSITDKIIAALPKPVGTVGDLAPEVTTNRLPSLATEDVVSEEQPETPMADVFAEDEVFDPEAGEAELETAEVAETEQAEPETVGADAVEAEPEAEPEVNGAKTSVAEVEIEPETAAEETVENANAAKSITDKIIAALPKPVGTVGDLAPEVTTNRLPSLATEEVETEDSPSTVASSPFERFASTAPIENDKPHMSIVLIDTGDSSLGVEALDSFPYPLTFAVDPSMPNAVKRMQVYRDKGFEVLALIDLPLGATASDVEVAMSAYLAAVPEAVGILEGVETGVQTSREMADQLTQIILDSGHGMLLQKSGLNTARKLAEREGIPAATVFRDFDGNGQSARVMRRFLDQAAFRAAQEGGVVMMGRLQAETISALLIWGLADRASRVALVPVSAVLKQDATDEG